MDGNYSITNDGLVINTSTDDTDYVYYFWAGDESENNITHGSSASPYTITVKDNDKPTANAGDDVSAGKDEVVTFDGAASTDNIGITSYRWTFTHADSPVSLIGASPTFTFTRSGPYDVTLNVSDAAGNWDTDVVKVSVASDISKPEDEWAVDERCPNDRSGRARTQK